MKAIFSLFLMLELVTLLTLNVPVQAANMDSSVETSASNSYVFTTYLKDDDIKVQSKDGVVTLTGSVSDESHKTMAGETVANIPAVTAVDNQLKIKGKQPFNMSDEWILTNSENHAPVPSQRKCRH